MSYGTDQGGLRDTIMACLLYACYQTLSSRGMTGMFVDGVSDGDQVLVSLGEFPYRRPTTKDVLYPQLSALNVNTGFRNGRFPEVGGI